MLYDRILAIACQEGNRLPCRNMISYWRRRALTSTEYGKRNKAAYHQRSVVVLKLTIWRKGGTETANRTPIEAETVRRYRKR